MMRFHRISIAFLLALAMVMAISLTAFAAPKRLVDEAGLLTESEKEDLLERLDQISEDQACDVVIVTNNSLDGRSARDYADDYYDYSGYGQGENRDGVLLLVSMGERDWYISTCGFGIDAFTDEGLRYMEKQIVPHLSDGDYDQAFHSYADLCEDFLVQARKGEPYDVGHMPRKPFNPLLLLGDFAAAFLLSAGAAARNKSKLKSVRKKTRAGVYMVAKSLHLNKKDDIFLRQWTDTRTIHRDDDRDSGFSGGSSVHTSSSGTSHGGHGGKF